MNRVRAFFLEEAAQCLSELRRPPAGVVPGDLARLHAAARRLRGSAQLARYAPVAAVAGPLERRLRQLARGEGAWNDDVAAEVARAIDTVVDAVQDVREGRTEQGASRNMTEQRQGQPDIPEVPIARLQYDRDAALARALDLRTPLEDAMATHGPVDAILDELFDLVRLGMK
jgi:chemotaxis protein histidine kinase CheA